MKNLMGILVAGLVAFGLLAGCSSATSSTTATPTPTPTVTSTVLAVSGTGSWPTVKVAFEPLSGKTITDATITFAIDANTLAASPWANITYDSTSNYSSNITLPSAAKTWETTAKISTLTYGTSASAFTSATSYVGLFYGYNASTTCTVYFKQVNLTYSDATTEVLTFPDSTGTTLTSVVGSTTTTPTVASRMWTWDTNTGAVATTAFSTVSF